MVQTYSVLWKNLVFRFLRESVVEREVGTLFSVLGVTADNWTQLLVLACCAGSLGPVGGTSVLQ
jgi:hypothetical protein